WSKRVHRAATATVALARVIGAAVVQQHPRFRDHDAAPEGHVQTLVQADRHPAPVDDAEVDRVAARGGGTRGTDEASLKLLASCVEPVEWLEGAERVQDQVSSTVG